MTIADIENAHNAVLNDPVYGEEYNLLELAIKAYPLNDNIFEVARKIACIDVTNSTHLASHKSNISLYLLAKIIVNIPNIDSRLSNGDPSLVNDIAKESKQKHNVNLFSFASKYCCYHNVFCYNGDAYSIVDNVVKSHLHNFNTLQHSIKKSTPETWQQHFEYEKFNDFIGNILNDNGINIAGRRRKFDHYVWYTYRYTYNNVATVTRQLPKSHTKP